MKHFRRFFGKQDKNLQTDYSFYQNSRADCPHCGVGFGVQMWLIIDCSARPDLLEQILHQNLHDFICPHCHLQVKLDVALLLYLADRNTALLFSPADGTTEIEDQYHADTLINQLQKQMGSRWQAKWMDQKPESVLRERLPLAFVGAGHESHLLDLTRSFIQAPSLLASRQVLAKHPDSLIEEVKSLLDQLIDEQKDRRILQMLEDSRNRLLLIRKPSEGSKPEILQESNRPKKITLTERRIEIPQTRATMESVIAFAMALTPASRQYVIEKHPELLSEQTDSALKQLAEIARSENNQDLAESLEEDRSKLQLYKMGISESFEKDRSQNDLFRQAGLDLKFIDNSDILNFLKLISLESSGLPKDLRETLEKARNDDDLIQMYIKRPDWIGLLGIALREHGGKLVRKVLAGDNIPYNSTLDFVTKISKQSTQLSMPSQLVEYVYEAEASKQRYLERGDLAALNKSISIWDYLIDSHFFAELTKTYQGGILTSASSVYIERHWALGDIDDLIIATILSQKALSLLPSDSLDRAIALTNYGNCLSQHYEYSNNLSDLRASIDACQEAVRITPANTPEYPALLNNLGAGFSDQYYRSGKLDDLEAAIHVFQEAAELLARDSPDSRLRSIALHNLGILWKLKYTHTGRLKELETALQYSQEALGSNEANSSALFEILAGFRSLLSKHSIYLNNSTDLESVVHALQELINRTSQSSLNIPTQLNSLGLKLLDHYSTTVEIEDLENAISIYQEAIRLSSVDTTHQSKYLNDLGMSFRDRYLRTSRIEDLETAIAFLWQAKEHSRPKSDASPSVLTNLGMSLGEQYDHTHELEDLDASLQFLQQAVEQTSPFSQNQPFFLSNLAMGLSRRYTRFGQLGDIDSAISLLRKAVELTPEISPDLPVRLINLGNALSSRYDASRFPEDLAEAIDISQSAIKSLPFQCSSRLGGLFNLASHLWKHHTHTANMESRSQALKLFETVCQEGLEYGPDKALSASLRWGNILEFGTEIKWSEVARAYGYGLDAVDRLYRAQLMLRNKKSRLSESTDIHLRAAYAFAHDNNLQEAVIALERGRVRMLADVLERDRINLQRLRQAGHVDLYERYYQATNRIKRLAASEYESAGISSRVSIGRELRSAQADLDHIVEEILQVDSSVEFFRRPTFSQIQHVNNGATTIYLAVYSHETLALAVSNAGVKRVTVNFSAKELEELLVRRDGDTEIGGLLPGQLGTIAGLRAALDETLPILGEKMIKPLLSELDYLGSVITPEIEREPGTITFIPMGKLALLPLHAAIYLLNGDKRTFMDDFVINYAPSALTLSYAGDFLMSLAKKPSKLFAVGNPLPLPKGLLPLVFAQSEVEEIAKFFGEQTQLLYDVEATRSAIEIGMSDASYIHLSCHGQFNLQEPLQSALILSNGERLTLANLFAHISLDSARLVVLSACQTAITDFHTLPDEMIGLPTGFLQAGVPGVVGTLWSVNDLSTALLMIKFYNNHLNDGLAPVKALRQAQLWLRDVTNAELSELFDFFRQDANNQATSRIAFDIAQSKFQEHTLSDPNDRPFSHPYFWAPFIFYGV